MPGNELEELTDLNKIALDEFKTLAEQNLDLLPEWKQTILQLLGGNDIPQSLDSLEQLVAGE